MALALAAGILVHGDQAGHTAALRGRWNAPGDRGLSADHDDVEVGARFDLAEWM